MLMFGVVFSSISNLTQAQAPCDPTTVLTSPNDDINNGFYNTRGGIQWLEASNKVTNSTTTSYQSENKILLKDGFLAANDDSFLAYITTAPCTTPTQEVNSITKDISNYPNPFTESTTIEFSLQESANIRIELYDLAGRFLEKIQSPAFFSKGIHQVEFDAKNFSSGIYLFKIIANQTVSTGRMTLIQ